MGCEGEMVLVNRNYMAEMPTDVGVGIIPRILRQSNIM